MRLKIAQFVFIGNIFICQRPSASAAGEGESEEEDDTTSAGVIYKIGNHVDN